MRSPAPAARDVPVWSPAAAAVIGGDLPGRRRTERLFADAGFAVHRDAASAGALILLLGRTSVTTHVREVKALSQAHADARILAVLPAEMPNGAMRRVLLAGAHGIVLDDEVERALVPAAHAMLAGQLTVPRVLGRQIAPRPLSHREKQILSLVVLGMTNREIARKLFLAESTIKTHLASTFRKLDARSRSEAVARIRDSENGYGTGILATDEGAPA